MARCSSVYGLDSDGCYYRRRRSSQVVCGRQFIGTRVAPLSANRRYASALLWDSCVACVFEVRGMFAARQRTIRANASF
jgi:hypothetical protein